MHRWVISRAVGNASSLKRSPYISRALTTWKDARESSKCLEGLFSFAAFEELQNYMMYDYDRWRALSLMDWVDPSEYAYITYICHRSCNHFLIERSPLACFSASASFQKVEHAKWYTNVYWIVQCCSICSLCWGRCTFQQLCPLALTSGVPQQQWPSLQSAVQWLCHEKSWGVAVIGAIASSIGQDELAVGFLGFLVMQNDDFQSLPWSHLQMGGIQMICISVIFESLYDDQRRHHVVSRCSWGTASRSPEVW